MVFPERNFRLIAELPAAEVDYADITVHTAAGQCALAQPFLVVRGRRCEYEVVRHTIIKRNKGVQGLENGLPQVLKQEKQGRNEQGRDEVERLAVFQVQQCHAGA